MGYKTLNLRDAVMRIMDEAANTPQAVTVCFIDGTLGPVPTAAPRPDETVVLNQGKGDAKIHRVIESDDAVFEPITMSMTFLMEASVNSQKVLSAMSNPFQEGTWQPDGSATFAPVTSIGSRKNADGTAVTCPLPADSVRRAGLVNVEIFAANPDGSSDDFGIKLAGVYFTPPMGSWSNPTGTFETTLEIYGAITDLTAGFTTPVTEL